MAMSVETLENLITQAFPDATVQIVDLAGDGDHYKAIITSTAFTGKNRVQQHQMVYTALGGMVGTTLHALALETRIPTAKTE